MADFDRPPRSGRDFNRKRRYRDDDDFDRRQQRRRYEEPLNVKVRKQLLSLADSPLRKPEDEINSISKLVVENYEDEELRASFVDILLQLVTEQPLKIPFVASVILVINPEKPGLTTTVLERAGAGAQKSLDSGLWREFKLFMRFLACLQCIYDGPGMFELLEELFSRAVDLQTASSEDALGLEIVKVILLTIPYILSSSSLDSEQHVNALLEKTDIIASTPHSLEALVNPYPFDGEEKPPEPQSLISLLQKQLQAEAASGWELACLPRPWKTPETEQSILESQKHPFPQIIVPQPVQPGPLPHFPELYISVYSEQELETVPPSSSIASSLIRDSVVDTINMLDFNRHATAKFLIDIDCFFSPNTFLKRATPFDKVREIADGAPTWKPEDVAVDAVFSQLLQLPLPEHKLVYYHSVLTESCKLAPAAIAPSLGRAIRFLYKAVDSMDLELEYRFMDWFAHHLSNFGFTWKWTEWTDDIYLPIIHPRKSFIVGALDKEIRLSFAQRIRGTLPEAYQPLISEAKEKDTPDFKYHSDQTPYCEEGKEILTLLRKKSPEDEIQVVVDRVHEKAKELGVEDVLIPSTDAYVTSICFIGSKSLSHVLSCIERCKERLLAIGTESEAARRQIILSVMDYWRDQPGVGVNIIDKLLNYTILTPISVIEWALIEHNAKGFALAHSHIFEMVSSTVFKVTNRVRQIVVARDQPGLPEPQVNLLQETLEKEKAAMDSLFTTMEDALSGFAEGIKDEMVENGDGDSAEEAYLREWGQRWLRVFRRKFAVEDAMLTPLNGTHASNGEA